MKRKTCRWLAAAAAFALAFMLNGTGVLAEGGDVATAEVGDLETTEGTYLSEDFDGEQDWVFPEGWTTEASKSCNKWVVGVGNMSNRVLEAHSGRRNARIDPVDFYAGQYSWLITPALDLSNATEDVTLSFWYANTPWGSTYDRLGVFYRVGDGDWRMLCQTTKGHEHWSKHVIVLPEESKAEAVQFGFRAENFNGCGIALDDIVIQNADQEESRAITYLANNGSEESFSESCYDWGVVTVQPNEFTAPEGKRFGGWNTEADGTGSNYRPGNQIVLKEDVTLYAQWLGTLTSLDEKFDSYGIPAGWSVICDDAGYGWEVGGNRNSLFSQECACMDHCNENCDGSSWLITPTLDLRGDFGNCVLSFSCKNTSYYGAWFELKVYYRVDGGEWNELKMPRLGHGNYWDYVLILLPKEARANNVEIGFQALEADSYGVAIDDVWLGALDYYGVYVSEDIVGGTVLSDMDVAEKGETVTLKVMGRGLNSLDELIIKKDGEEISFEQVDDTTFTFVMPDGDVSVNATFFLREDYAFYEGFDEEGALDGWTFVDADGDGYGWVLNEEDKDNELDRYGNCLYQSAYNSLGSASYYSQALFPDNWAITPAIEVPANAVLSFWIKGYDPEWAEEVMAVYVGSTTNPEDMKLVGGDYVADSAFTQYTVNLGEYAGETVYVGFRHYNVSDMYWLILDDVLVYAEEDLTDENLKVTKKGLRLMDTISIDFKVPASAFEGYRKPYLLVTQNDKAEKLTDYYEDKGLLIFTYRVAPHKMCDLVTAVPHALTEDGRDVRGEEFSYSVIEYCYNMLYKDKFQGDTYAPLRRLLVDILRYGEAAQIYANYNTELLATCDLSEGVLAMGTDVTVPMSYQSVKEKLYMTVEEENALASIEKAALYLEAVVNVQFKFAAEDLTGLRVVITDDEECTNVIAQYPVKESQIDDNDLYYVNVNKLNAGEMRKTIYATVMKDDQKVSNTYRYSIESYVYSMRTNEGTSLDKLLDAMMRYGDSAAAYVSNN